MAKIEPVASELPESSPYGRVIIRVQLAGFSVEVVHKLSDDPIGEHYWGWFLSIHQSPGVPESLISFQTSRD